MTCHRSCRYCNELGEYRVQQWPLVAYQDFYYRKELQAKGSGSKKSLLRLVQEISSLATSLPVAWSTSVFLLTDENRMDIIRSESPMIKNTSLFFI